MKVTVGTNKNLVYIGDECFRPGQRIFAEIIRCLEKTAVVVAAVSRNFCNSYYCKQEVEEARILDKPVILVFIEDVKENEMSDVMKEIFRNFTRVKIVRRDGAYQSQPDWPNVCRSIIDLMNSTKVAEPFVNVFLNTPAGDTCQLLPIDECY